MCVGPYCTLRAVYAHGDTDVLVATADCLYVEAKLACISVIAGGMTWLYSIQDT